VTFGPELETLVPVYFYCYNLFMQFFCSPSKEDITAVFDRWAWLYDFEKYFFFPLRRKAAKFLGLPINSKVLDVATGTGAQAYELARLGYDVTGADLSSGMLAQAAKKLSPNLKLKFLQADATKLPFPDDSFDASTVSLALHDMSFEVEIGTLNEMKRVTKSGGIILIVDYSEPSMGFVPKLSHEIVRLYESPNYLSFIQLGLLGLLEKMGLSIQSKTGFLGVVQIVKVVNSE